MLLQLERKTSAYLIIAFILLTVIGTLSHELGHYCMAKYYYGFHTQLSYNYTFWDNETAQENFWITFWGPLQTMITGTLGFIFLVRTAPAASYLSFKKWCLVFLSLFWMREPFDLLMWVAKRISTGFFQNTNDEVKMGIYWGLPDGTLLILCGIIGLLITLFIIFKIIPPRERFTFIFSGSIGGAAGFIIWMMWLGPILLPYTEN